MYLHSCKLNSFHITAAPTTALNASLRALAQKLSTHIFFQMCSLRLKN